MGLSHATPVRTPPARPPRLGRTLVCAGALALFASDAMGQGGDAVAVSRLLRPMASSGMSFKTALPRNPGFSGRAAALLIIGGAAGIFFLTAIPGVMSRRRQAEESLRQADGQLGELEQRARESAGALAQAKQEWQKEIEHRTAAEEALAESHETLLAEICERKQVEEELLQAHEKQESRVQQRTAALNAANAALQGEILERQRAEEALLQAHAELEARVHERTAELAQANEVLTRKNEEIQNFYHTLSHELKTPLTSAREFIAIVLDGLAGPINRTQAEYLGIARESCNQLRVCINDLLDVTRLETGKLSIDLKPASLAAVAQRVVTILRPAAAEKKLTLTCEIQPGLPDVPIDENRVMQIITNLLNNALKFTDEGGRIAVEVGVAPGRNPALQVAVRDSGCGIPADKLDKVFDRLYQVRSGDMGTGQGVGLGLYICRELVGLHGGEIRADSEAGRGSTFTFTIPQTPMAQRAALIPACQDSPPNHRRQDREAPLAKLQP